MPRTNFYGPKDVRVIGVRLYVVGTVFESCLCSSGVPLSKSFYPQINSCLKVWLQPGDREWSNLEQIALPITVRMDQSILKFG